jgi:outer membrane protein
MALNIAGAYLQILLSQEQVENARRQLTQTEALLVQTDKLIQAGVLAVNERLAILAQVALNEQTLIQAQNALQSGYLVLRQLLELPPGEPFQIVRPEVVVPPMANPDSYNWQEVYVSALGTQPQIEAGEKRIASAEEGLLSGALAGLAYALRLRQPQLQLVEPGQNTGWYGNPVFPRPVPATRRLHHHF